MNVITWTCEPVGHYILNCL